MTALIFGINGQDGYYLTKLLKMHDINVVGVSRHNDDCSVKGDVADFSLVESLVKKHQPDYVFHLAANSTTSHTALFDNHLAISTGTLNILENVRNHCPAAKVFLSGSAMQFRNSGLPINEQTPFEASSPYSVARIQSVYAGRYYRAAFGLLVYTGYFFNHDSPLRSERHVNQKIANSAKRIASGSPEKLEIGNIEVKKEFNYAGDVVEAVWTLVNQTGVFEAVIGCGEAHTIKEWLEYCFSKTNSDWRNSVTIKDDYIPEYDTLVCDPSIIRSLGWQPRVNFSQLADLMMEEV